MNEIGLAALLTLAISQGVVAAFNPCGFAMLPAYLSYFLGLDSDGDTNPARSVGRGLVVGLTLTAGFLAFFGAIGVVASTIVSRSAIESRIAWATLVLGALMIPLGLAMILGFEPRLPLPRLDRGGRTRELPSIFLFGVSYAVVSLGCTAAIFFGTVVTSFTSRSVVEGTLVFLAYGTGMSLVILVLTLAMSMARAGIATAMRRLLPYVNRMAGVLLVLAGAFLVVFGWWEVQTLRGDISTSPLVRESLEFQSTLTNWAAEVGPTKIAVAASLILAGIVVWAVRPLLSGAQRLAVTATVVGIWLVVEIVNYDFELFVLPTLRTAADVPERVGNWFTDPLRWPVLFEVLAGLVALTVIVLGVKRHLHADGAGAHAGRSRSAAPVQGSRTVETPEAGHGANRSRIQEPSTSL